jgi:D-serine deaminase-like pyridoxal phosphate-dependent protein
MKESPYALNPRDLSELLSPGLLIFRGLVRQNIQNMIAMAGGAERVRPHVKTHKTAEIIRLAESMGVRKHKCATLAEAEMVAAAGGSDVLVSYPLVGPNLKRFANLVRGYRNTTFRATVDHPESARALSESMAGLDRPVPVLLDLDIGMGRTGIEPGEEAAELYALVDRLPHLVADGLHAYDGHIRDTDLADRRKNTQAGMERALVLRDRLVKRGQDVPRLVIGGTPTFPIHADLDVPGVECSPGTVVLHDDSYSTRFPDLPFTPAALLLTRVVSRPRSGRLCLDLGYKAVAADPAGPRARLLGIDDAKAVIHSEEHLVIETARADDWPIGAAVLAIPTHICPTMALHRRTDVIEDGEVVARWEVTARDRVVGL